MELLHLGKTGEAVGGLETPDSLVRPDEDESGETEADRLRVDTGLAADVHAEARELAPRLLRRRRFRDDAR